VNHASARGPIRVFVVDDALLVRRFVSEALSADPDIEVVGTASNGRAALAKLDALGPHLVTLDIEMPEMDGLETLSAIRAKHPRLPVIMFSTLTERGASQTLDALSRGASDYVTKPSHVGGVAESMERVRQDLVPRVKALCAWVLDRSISPPATGRRSVAAVPSPLARPTRASTCGGPSSPWGPLVRPGPALSAGAAVAARRPGPVDIVAVGVSTGGPSALVDLVPTLPADFPVPIVVVQHMPPVFTKLLAQRLDHTSALGVVEGAPGMAVEPGVVYLAPGGDHHMLVRREHGAVRLHLISSPPEHSCRPAVDPLFRSVAETFGGAALAVVLTGMGSDGSLGVRALRDAGAHVIVQDEATSVVWGMPGVVARAGHADEILPLDAIGPALVRHAEARRRGAARPDGPLSSLVR
jgi:two-component system chemotaxis response regulator CheB